MRMCITILRIAVQVECTSLLQAKQAHQVTQFQILNWNEDGVCDNYKTVTDINEEVAKIQRRTGNKSIVVHCRLVCNEHFKCIECIC